MMELKFGAMMHPTYGEVSPTVCTKRPRPSHFKYVIVNATLMVMWHALIRRLIVGRMSVHTNVGCRC